MDESSATSMWDQGRTSMFSSHTSCPRRPSSAGIGSSLSLPDRGGERHCCRTDNAPAAMINRVGGLTRIHDEASMTTNERERPDSPASSADKKYCAYFDGDCRESSIATTRPGGSAASSDGMSVRSSVSSISLRRNSRCRPSPRLEAAGCSIRRNGSMRMTPDLLLGRENMLRLILCSGHPGFRQGPHDPLRRAQPVGQPFGRGALAKAREQGRGSGPPKAASRKDKNPRRWVCRRTDSRS